MISLHIIYKNIQFRFAKPNISSKMVGWLVGVWDGKIQGLNVFLNNKKKSKVNEEMVSTNIFTALMKPF